MQEAFATTSAPKSILATKTSGPNGVLAYMPAHGLDETGLPFFDKNVSKPSEIYYALVATNRVGIVVVTPPAGTQDVIVVKDNQKISIELGKDKNLEEALGKIGRNNESALKGSALEEYTIKAYQDAGYAVRLETSWEAAVRETREEQGVDLNKLSIIGSPCGYSLQLITKRSLERSEKEAGRELFSLTNIRTLNDVAQWVETQRAGLSKSDQAIFAVRVENFSGTVLNRADRIEQKIPGRKGASFYEAGVFLTLAQMREELAGAVPAAQAEQAKGNDFARTDLVASYERLSAIANIESDILKDLRKQNIFVKSDVSNRTSNESAGEIPVCKL